ncbi:2-hydroxyacid dehydrogenase [Phascolarctobacterium sp.]
MKIVVMEPLGVALEKINALAAALQATGHEFVYYTSKETQQDKLLERVQDADIIMLANQPLSAEIINACPKLKMLSVAFTGVDHIALDACRARNILVCNAAGYSTNAVAELTFGLAISVIRNIVPCDARCRRAETKDGLVGFELFGKTFGVVGTGAIGARVAKIAAAFGCRVLAYSRTAKQELVDAGVQYVSLDELLAQSDFVSLHVPLTDATRGLINADAIAKMKQGAVLLNTARGPVVDSAALAEALNAGKLAGAGIDVFEGEPPIAEEHPLCSAKNTVLTPHVAFASREALETRADIVFANIEKWLNGAPQNVVR